MREGLINGNGCLCDVCHTPLYPSEAIKIKSFTKNKYDSTGKYCARDIRYV